MLPISQELLDLADQVEEKIVPVCKNIKRVAFLNQRKVLDAFAQERITEYHLKGTTGYGYGDQGRDALERVVARVMGAEAALVRSQIVSGTHAIALALFGILRPGDELLSVTGSPYDTLEEIIGLKGEGGKGSLRDWGVTYKQVNLLPDGSPDFAGIRAAIGPQTKMVAIQRSRGYAIRPALGLDKMAELISAVKEIRPDVVVFVDNCYGELVEEKEPTEIGADLIAGSLIKNLGGGLAPTGGYVAGRRDLVELAACRWTAPGISGAVGSSLDINRALYQGLFQAPHVVGEALQGAVFTAELFTRLGFQVSPAYNEFRSDLVQAIILGEAQLVKAFCLGLQQASPVDSFVVPEAWAMPGYQDQVIMAGGTFVQGSTIELSGDAPMRDPYAVYMQGGLNLEHVKLGALLAAQNVLVTRDK
ncbi:MAG TPA: methionine gamma-lyase family protein [Bacillota bacterium]|nr:methionine gamma-lyase family protein [Bacillota bacterium]